MGDLARDTSVMCPRPARSTNHDPLGVAPAVLRRQAGRSKGNGGSRGFIFLAMFPRTPFGGAPAYHSTYAGSAPAATPAPGAGQTKKLHRAEKPDGRPSFHFPSARVRWRSPTGARRAASVLEGRLPTRAYPQSTPAPHAASFATADGHSPTHRQRCLAAPADGPPSPSRLQWDLEQRVASIVDSTLKDISQRYKIQEELGAGAQATVYKATHKRNHMKARPLRTPPAAAARVSQRAASPAGRHQGDRDQGARGRRAL